MYIPIAFSPCHRDGPYTRDTSEAPIFADEANLIMSRESPFSMGSGAVAVAMALCLACALPAATALEANQGVFTATGLAAQGAAVTGGRLGGIRLASPADPASDTVPQPVPSLEISSPDFRIETDHQRQNISVVVGSPLPPDVWTSTEEPTSGTIIGGGARLYDLFIAPLAPDRRPNITVQTDVLELSQGQKTDVVQKDVMDAREPMAAGVEGDQELAQRSGPRHVTINGSFLAVFWEWDLEVAAQEATYEFPSGYTYNDTVSVTPEIRGVGSTHSRQTYVFVNQGELSLVVQEADWMDFFMMAQQVAVEGRLVIQDAAPVGDPSPAHDREFRGALHVSVEPTDDARLRIAFQADTLFEGAGPQGAPATKELDLPRESEPVPGGVAAAPVAGRLPWAEVSTSAILALGTAGAVRFAIDTRKHARLNHWMDAKDYASVVAATSRLPRARRFRHEAAVMRTVCLLKLDRPDDALTFLDELSAKNRPDAGTFAYLQAASHARLGRYDEAASHLATCLATTPSYRDEVLGNSWFQPVLGHPEVMRRLGAEPHGPTGAYA